MSFTSIAITVVLLSSMPVLTHAQSASIDTDGDGLSDEQETTLYRTATHNPDTDGDGYSDGQEIKNGYSPLMPGPQSKLSTSDTDWDGLSDGLEYKFKTDPTNPDTDGDGYSDGAEIRNGYDPTDKTDRDKKLAKQIEINLKGQRMKKILGGVVLAEYPISTGKWKTPTPKGTFKILNKTPRAWSKTYGLYMPWWMAFTRQGHGIHELPEWPNGYKEGTNHLGTPVSHGCVRLGIGPAKDMYDWAPVGTPVVVR
ncbi:L,D-transpeptidase family protein [Candidatus Uhrbacteria bacterium]|nr:L,D-transpeptidase family protein [Candidatus Uhrbacteria bacterium]